MKKLSVAIIIFTICSFASSAWVLPARAGKEKETVLQESPLIPEKLVLDGKEYTHDDLLKAFKSVVFADSTTGRGGHSPKLPSPEDLKKGYPWLFEHIYHEKGIPRYVAVNKWTKPIVISTGYPNNLWRYDYNAQISFSDDGYRGPYSDQEEEKIAAEEVNRLAPILQKLTGLPVSFISHDKEIQESFAPLRIVFADSWPNWDTKFRLKKGGRFEHTVARIGHTEEFWTNVLPMLDSAVPFTPSSRFQVQGFFLPDQNNHIDMAFCYIQRKQDPEILRALIQECVVRSLGLPNSTDIKTDAVISLWNDPARTPNAKENAANSAPQTLTEFDKFFISLLYNPKVKAGMWAQALLKIL